MNTETRTPHTPGPWYAPRMLYGDQGLIVAEETGENIAVSYDKKNARLIAAAPDLLAALTQIIDAYETGGEGDFDAAMRAIALATGQQVTV